MVIGYFAGLPSLKRFGSSRCDDWVDRLNHVHTSLLLLTLAILISTTHLVGSPIKCWVPAEFDDEDEHTNSFEHYIHNYCWMRNTYYIPMLDVIPTDVSRRQEEEITYYQWVPLILLLQAFLFKLPFILWKMLHVASGLNLSSLCKTAELTQCTSPEDRKGAIESLVFVMEKWIHSHQPYKHNALARAKARFSHVFCFYCNKREGTFLTGLYLFIKVLYFANVVGQIFLLNAFITTDQGSMYGLEWLQSFRSGSKVMESQRFPRVTLCDFLIRQMNNVQRYTVQCVLPINLFNEKIFLFLWFWFCFVAILSGYNFIKWIILIVVKRNNYDYVKKYLKLGGRTLQASDKQLCKKFAEKYLRDDGCFVARMVGMNSTDMVIMDMFSDLFAEYKERQKPDSSDENSHGHAVPEQ
ncbi:innexin unc-9-like isoform X2 [Mercenaria mercenaria]|uniref:innexin unc-9-like isoform X2 n=1 Tax=Mercenaria mercenaria TaxID=6596 RepID=UPI00234F3860|nr:innexin unc-9-like isoform X2 [Mercenaria mercenaria]